MRLQRADLLRVYGRLLFVQATLHRKGMQNIGVMHALDAVAPQLTPDPAALIARHTEHFNTNPNAAPIVVGAIVRIEEDGSRGAPASVARFKQVACSALAAMGDVMVVGGLKPLALTLAMVSAIYSFFAGLLAIVVLHNTALLAVRWWGLRVGYTRGWAVVEAFTGGRVQRVVMLSRILAALAGGVLVAVIARRAYGAGFDELALVAAATAAAWLTTRRGWSPARLAIALFPLVVGVAMLVK